MATTLPLTVKWMTKMATKHPEWAEAARCTTLMKSATPSAPYYYSYQFVAVQACVRAMLSMPKFDIDAIECQAQDELDHNMRDRVNYSREFKYDVLVGYLRALDISPYNLGRLA